MFKLADFESISTEVIFRNLTSRADPLPSEAVSIQEVREDSLVLGVPTHCCNVQHSVDFTLRRSDPQQPEPPLVLHATGKVLEVESTDDRALVRIRVALLQYDEALWKKLLSLIDGRQQRVNELIRQIRD